MSNESDSWVTKARMDFERGRAAFEAAPEFQSLVAAAAERGFRRITLAEQLNAGEVEAFSWRGGVWVKL